MGQVQSVTFFYPSRVIGGAEFQFIRLSRYLQTVLGVKVYYVDYLDGFARQQLAGEPIEFITYEDNQRLTLDYDTHVVTPLSCIFKIQDDLALSSQTKIMFWSLHPINLFCNIPYYHYILKKPYPEIKKFLRWFYPGDCKTIRQALQVLHNHHSIVFMDYLNYAVNDILFDLDWKAPHYIQIPVVQPKTLAPHFNRIHPQEINIAWLGNIVDEKVYPLLKIIEDAVAFSNTYNQKIRIHVIGAGHRDQEIRDYLPPRLVDIKMLGKIIQEDLDDYLANHVDILFAMGPSALEGAKLSIPTIALDFSFNPMPKDYQYNWLYEMPDFALGMDIELKNCAFEPHSFENLIAEIYNNNQKQAFGERCYQYYSKNHTIEIVSGVLLETLEKIHFSYADLLMTGIYNVHFHREPEGPLLELKNAALGYLTRPEKGELMRRFVYISLKAAFQKWLSGQKRNILKLKLAITKRMYHSPVHLLPTLRLAKNISRYQRNLQPKFSYQEYLRIKKELLCEQPKFIVLFPNDILLSANNHLLKLLVQLTEQQFLCVTFHTDPQKGYYYSILKNMVSICLHEEISDLFESYPKIVVANGLKKPGPYEHNLHGAKLWVHLDQMPPPLQHSEQVDLIEQAHIFTISEPYPELKRFLHQSQCLSHAIVLNAPDAFESLMDKINHLDQLSSILSAYHRHPQKPIVLMIENPLTAENTRLLYFLKELASHGYLCFHCKLSQGPQSIWQIQENLWLLNQFEPLKNALAGEQIIYLTDSISLELIESLKESLINPYVWVDLTSGVQLNNLLQNSLLLNQTNFLTLPDYLETISHDQLPVFSLPLADSEFNLQAVEEKLLQDPYFWSLYGDLNLYQAIAVKTTTFLDYEGKNFYSGGAERYLLDLNDIAQALGYRFLVYQYGHTSWTRRYGRVEVCSLSDDALSLDHLSTDNIRQLSQLFYHMAHEKVALGLYSSFLHAWPQAVEPNIGISHGVGWDDPRSHFNDGSLFWEFNRFTLESLDCCNKVVSVDSNTANWVQTVKYNASHKMKVIPNYVDLDTFYPRLGYDTPRKECVILYPRRLYEARGLYLVLEMMDDILERFPKVSFHFVGKGFDEDTQHVVKKQEQWGKRVKWDSYPPEEMHLAYQDADIALIPTLYSEGTSLSCLEAMASGNAVIATRVGGLSDLVLDNYNGLMIEPNAEALKSAIEDLLTHPDRLQAFKRKGVEVAKAFSKEQWQQKWIEVIRENVRTAPQSAKSPSLLVEIYLKDLPARENRHYLGYLVTSLLRQGHLVYIRVQNHTQPLYQRIGRLQWLNWSESSLSQADLILVDEQLEGKLSVKDHLVLSTSWLESLYASQFEGNPAQAFGLPIAEALALDKA